MQARDPTVERGGQYQQDCSSIHVLNITHSRLAFN